MPNIMRQSHFVITVTPSAANSGDTAQIAIELASELGYESADEAASGASSQAGAAMQVALRSQTQVDEPADSVQYQCAQDRRCCRLTKQILLCTASVGTVVTGSLLFAGLHGGPFHDADNISGRQRLVGMGAVTICGGLLLGVWACCFGLPRFTGSDRSQRFHANQMPGEQQTRSAPIELALVQGATERFNVVTGDGGHRQLPEVIDPIPSPTNLQPDSAAGLSTATLSGTHAVVWIENPDGNSTIGVRT